MSGYTNEQVFVYILLGVSGAFIVGMLGVYPGFVAVRNRRKDATRLAFLGLAGLLLTAGIGWLVTLMYAHTPPDDPRR